MLNSTISFVMDTLVQHHEMVGQLQDEVAALRSQMEEILALVISDEFWFRVGHGYLAQEGSDFILDLNAL
jgi:hypothetical protein